MEIRLSGKLVTLVLLFTLCTGALCGGALVFGCEWGAYSDLMARSSEASKRGEGFVIFDMTTDNDVPVIVNEIALARMADLRLQQIQDLNLACQEHNKTPKSRDLIPEGEYRGPKDSPWVVSVLER